MSKFCKRIRKTINYKGNALVVGDGFDFLEDIVTLFPSVFVVLSSKEKIKAKNIIYRDKTDDLHLLPEIDVVFLDRKFQSNLDMFENLMAKSYPYFVVEGDDFLSMDYTKKFFQLGYRGTDRQGYFHIWKKIK